MRVIKLSTAYNLSVFMADSSDHVTGKTGLTLTTTASKDGAAFASISPTVTELASGWYSLALTTTHTNTVGDLAIHITSTGADPTDLACVVRANVLGDTLPANVLQFGSSNGTFASGIPETKVASIAANAITASAINADAITAAKIADGAIDAATFAAGAINAAAIAADAITDAKVASDVTIASVTGAVGSVTGAVGSVTGSVGSVASGGISAASLAADAITAAKLAADVGSEIATSVRTELATELARVDVATSTRLATVGYTAPLDAAGTRTAVGLASANLDTQLDALPTNAELSTALGTADDAVLAQIALVKAQTDLLPSDPADQSIIIAATNSLASAISALNNISTADVATQIANALTAAVADSVPADGSRPSIAQAAYITTQFLLERAVSGTSMVVRKPDGSTSLLTLTLDDSVAPTSVTRSA